MINAAKDCKKIIGKAPSKFAIIGMGSQALEENTSFSDFEHVIMLNPKFDGKNKEILNYFEWYSVIFKSFLFT